MNKIINPLLNVPLNTKSIYVMAEASSGCKVYMPVDNDCDVTQIRKKEELQLWLDNQSCNELPPLVA